MQRQCRLRLGHDQQHSRVHFYSLERVAQHIQCLPIPTGIFKPTTFPVMQRLRKRYRAMSQWERDMFRYGEVEPTL